MSHMVTLMNYGNWPDTRKKGGIHTYIHILVPKTASRNVFSRYCNKNAAVIINAVADSRKHVGLSFY